jgi:hypothetical protein
VVPGGQGPLIGGPWADETTTDRWARSYLISIRNKHQKMNFPWEKYLGARKNLVEIGNLIWNTFNH